MVKPAWPRDGASLAPFLASSLASPWSQIKKLASFWLHGRASLASWRSQFGSISGLTTKPDKKVGLVTGSMVEPEKSSYRISATALALVNRGLGAGAPGK